MKLQVEPPTLERLMTKLAERTEPLILRATGDSRILGRPDLREYCPLEIEPADLLKLITDVLEVEA